MSHSVSPPYYDTLPWNVPVHRHSHEDTTLSSGVLADGIHQIALPGGQSLDFLFQGLGMLDTASPRILLVGFSAAIAARGGKKAPFFSGQGVAKALNLPLVAVSDPTLALDAELPLAWYAGNVAVPDLPDRIARVLNHLARQHNAHLLLFGGSAGGYAALRQAELLDVESTVLVWCPQTSISRYVPQFVRHYLITAFPELSSHLEAVSSTSSEDFVSVLNKGKIAHEVRGVSIGEKVKLLYLQNQGDWHVVHHAGPYLSGKAWIRLGKATFADSDGRCALFFGKWGEGHAIPPKQMIQATLSQLVIGKKVTDVARFLEQGLPNVCDAPPYHPWFALAPPGFALRIRAWFDEEGQVHGAVEPQAELAGDVLYCFYLVGDGKRLEASRFAPISTVIFPRQDVSGSLELLAFAQDSFGIRVSARVPVAPLPDTTAHGKVCTLDHKK